MSEARARAGWSAASDGALAVLYFIMARGLQVSAAVPVGVLNAKATVRADALDGAAHCPRTAVQAICSQGGEDAR
jgi:hypothetical protein